MVLWADTWCVYIPIASTQSNIPRCSQVSDYFRLCGLPFPLLSHCPHCEFFSTKPHKMQFALGISLDPCGSDWHWIKVSSMLYFSGLTNLEASDIHFKCKRSLFSCSVSIHFVPSSKTSPTCPPHAPRAFKKQQVDPPDPGWSWSAVFAAHADIESDERADSGLFTWLRLKMTFWQLVDTLPHTGPVLLAKTNWLIEASLYSTW